MIEKIAMMGEARNLVGVVTDPDVDAISGTDLAFILLNAGVLHRVGPGRLNVKLARRLAKEGYESLRFDLSGIGDSRASQTTLSFEAQAVADIRTAMDHLQTARGRRRFVLVGLCSGADNGYATALADERVVGVVMLDPNGYPTWKTRVHFLLMGIGQPRWLLESLRIHIRRMVPTSGGGEDGAGDAQRADPSGPERYERPKPPLAEFAAGLASITNRGGAVIAIYSGSSLRQINDTSQFDEALKRFGVAGRVGCRLLAEANHTFTELSAQTELLDIVVAWVRAAHFNGRVARLPAA